MSEDDVEYQLYRCPTRAGFKDWAIGIGRDGTLRTQHCATGQTVRRTDIPASSYTDVHQEQERRVREKLAKGYVYIGTARVKEGRLQQKESKTAAIDAGIHWEIAEPIDRAEFLAWLRSTVERLNSGPLPNRTEFDADAEVCRVHAKRTWEFGCSDAGGIGKEGRGGGKILREHGVLPLLILTALQRTFASVCTLADDSGAVLTPRLLRDDPVLSALVFNHDLVLELGERLGLCVGRVRLLESKDSAHTPAVWF